MKYPNNIKKLNNSYVEYGNRGMNLETAINQSNEYYLRMDKAVIYKKPTPIKILKLDYKTNKIYSSYTYPEDDPWL